MNRIYKTPSLETIEKYKNIFTNDPFNYEWKFNEEYIKLGSEDNRWYTLAEKTIPRILATSPLHGYRNIIRVSAWFRETPSSQHITGSDIVMSHIDFTFPYFLWIVRFCSHDFMHLYRETRTTVLSGLQ
jgi:hypothetical protein